MLKTLKHSKTDVVKRKVMRLNGYISINYLSINLQIVATPFDFTHTNELLKNAKSNNITSVIIVFDTPIDAAGYYSDPVIFYTKI